MSDEPEDYFELKEWHKYVISALVVAIVTAVCVFAPNVTLGIAITMMAILAVVCVRHLMFW